ncbi:MAG: 3-isopropylmalate dehydrogenase [Acidimicrobiales bacterium]
MGRHKVAVIGGDGIGPEVVAEALEVAAAAGADLDTVPYDLGAARFERTGEVLPDKVMEELAGVEAILLGAVGPPVGSKTVPPGTLERGLLLRLRFELDLYINLRPSVMAPRMDLPRMDLPRMDLPRMDLPRMDLMVVRENTEGTYAGEGGFLRRGTPLEVATQGSVNTRAGVERCLRYAFELAASRPRRLLTLVHKTNVLTYAGDLWQRAFEEVSEEYPQVSCDYNHVDATCIYLVEAPDRYDVIVTDNLFGDIITDLAAALSGGIGLAASANLNPARTGPSLFEPVHGAAHDIAGTGRANPLAAISSVAMMLDFLGETDAGARVAKAVAGYLADQQSRHNGGGDSQDGGDNQSASRASTRAVGAAIAERV